MIRYRSGKESNMAWSRNMDWSVFDDIPKKLKRLYLDKLKIDEKYPRGNI